MRRRDRARLDWELGAQALPAPLLTSGPGTISPAGQPTGLAAQARSALAEMPLPGTTSPAGAPPMSAIARAAALLESWDADEPDQPASSSVDAGDRARSRPVPPEAIDLSDTPKLINRPGLLPAQRRAEAGTGAGTDANSGADREALTLLPREAALPGTQDTQDTGDAEDDLDGVDAGLAEAMAAELESPLPRPAAAPAALPVIQSDLAEPLLAAMLATVGSMVAWGIAAPASIWLPLATFPAMGLIASMLRGGDRARLARAAGLLGAAALLPTLSSAMTPVTLLAALAVAAAYPLLTGRRTGWLTTAGAVLSLTAPLVVEATRTGPEAFITSFTSSFTGSGSGSMTAARFALACGVVVAALIGMSSMATRRMLTNRAGLASTGLAPQHRASEGHSGEDLLGLGLLGAGLPGGSFFGADIDPDGSLAPAGLSLTRDQATGLPTRRALLRHLDGVLSQADTTDAETTQAGTTLLRAAPAGIAVIEIDQFASIAARIGTQAAEDVAAQVGLRLRDCLPGEQFVARITGHQYAVVIRHAEGQAFAGLVSAVSACLQVPVATAGHPDSSVTCSIGTALHTADLGTAAALLDAADEAVRAAQRTGRSRTVMFDQAVRAHAQTQASLEVELREAVTAGTIGALYQPLLALGTGDDDDRIVGAEAVPDWTRADGSVVPPERFLAIAEDLGLSRTLGLQMLDLALDALLDWRAEGVGVDQVWVNLAASQLSGPGLAGQISTRLTSRGLSPAALVIEVDAASLAEHDDALPTLSMLRSLGVAIALDQFGRSGTSLTALRSLPINAVKVDPRLGAALADQDAVPRSIVQLCHALGLRVVVEGVQTLTQLHGAREIAADAVQGYAIAQPLPACDVTNLLSLRLPREFRLR